MNDSPLAPYLVPLRRWWWVVAGLVAAAVAVTALTLPTREEGASVEVDRFAATHLLIRNGEAPTQLSFDLITLLSRQGELVNRVAARMDGTLSLGEVQSAQVATDPATQTISVSVIRPTPNQAAELATTYANELVRFLDERTLDTIENDYQRATQRLEEMQASVAALEERIEARPEGDAERRLLEADLAGLIQEYGTLRNQQRSLAEQRDAQISSFVTLEQPSPVPAVDEGGSDLLTLPRRPWLRLALSTIIAAMLGAAVVLGIDRLDVRVRTRRQAEEAFGLPVIAELPRRPRRHVQRQPLPAYHDPGGVTAEVLRALRLSVALAPTWHLTSIGQESGSSVGKKTPVKLDGEVRSIVITSTLTGDGKSTLAANLAVSIAESGKRVLVVDCDFRRPAVGKLLSVDDGPGLRELAYVAERPLHELASPTEAPNVAMVRSGTRGVTPPWFAGEAAQLVQRCAEMADVVIFDTGPITLTNEASALLPHVDTALVVLRSGKVTRDQARDAVERLTQVGACVSGVVMVGSETRRRYGYGYYQADGDGEREETARVARAPRDVSEGDGGSIWESNRPTEETPLAHAGRSDGSGPEGEPIAPRSRRSRRGSAR